MKAQQDVIVPTGIARIFGQGICLLCQDFTGHLHCQAANP
jgi:hypothetical protein